MTERERAVYCRAWRRSAGIRDFDGGSVALLGMVCWALPCGLFDLGYDVALPASSARAQAV
jgi:hypothetical protein